MEVIYDFETMSQNALNGAVVCIAAIEYDEKRFISNPYTYKELVDMSQYRKFDIKEQLEKYNRKIQKEALEWWKKQKPEVLQLIQPSSEDVSITELYPFLIDEMHMATASKVFTRGNTFDPIIVRTIFEELGLKDPTPYWSIRDVRSFIEGFTFGTDIFHAFVPKDAENDFIAHDPRHDVAMDVYRMQFLIRTMYGEDESV